MGALAAQAPEGGRQGVPGRKVEEEASKAASRLDDGAAFDPEVPGAGAHAANTWQSVPDLHR